MDIMLSSLSESTLKNYDGTLKNWWQFCAKKNVRPLDPKVSNVLEFLTQEYDKGLSHSTLNAMRSAITNARPSRPKYAYTWDPKIVLNFFKKQPPNEN